MKNVKFKYFMGSSNPFRRLDETVSALSKFFYNWSQII